MVVQPQDIAIAIKTHDRSPRRNYLEETIENLNRSLNAGPRERCPVHISDGRGLTLHQNAATAIRYGVEMQKPWVLVLEDDLDFCGDFLGSVARWLSDWASPAYPLYVFGANYAQIAQAAAAGHSRWEYPVHAFYGAQALCWRRDVAEELVQWLGEDPYYPGPNGEPIRDHGHDLLLQRWGRWKGAQYFLASAPSFCQHIGEESGINNRFFRFEIWPGREWMYPGKGGEGR